MKTRDQHSRRLHPRLRVYANCDDQVNALRSEISTSVASTLPATAAAQIQSLADSDLGEAQRCQHALQRSVVPARSVKARRPRKLSAQPPAKNAFVNVFVQFLPEQRGALGRARAKAHETLLGAMRAAATSEAAAAVRGAILPRRNFVVATVPVAMLDTLKKNEAVAFVHAAEPLKLAVPEPRPGTQPPARAIKAGKTGAGVLIGIIDVGGFDFAHPDFLDKSGKTRFVSIWDQGGDTRQRTRCIQLRLGNYGCPHERRHCRSQEARRVTDTSARAPITTE